MTARDPLNKPPRTHLKKRPLALEVDLENEEGQANNGSGLVNGEVTDVTSTRSKRMCHDIKYHSVSDGNRGPAPFTCELPLPKKRLVPLTYEEALRGTAEPVRVYADGIFDLFHLGHSHGLLQAKKVFPNTHLIAGVNSQKLTNSLKGKTVCNEVERYDAVRHCRYVDEVLTDAPWVMTPDLMEKYRIDFVAHDDKPYACGNVEDVYKAIKDMGRFVTIKRNTGVSTSDIIARIVRDYDVYLKRNFDRGYTARDLNVSFMKAKEVKLRETMQRGRSMLGGFMSLFGRGGKISEYFRGQKTNGVAAHPSVLDEDVTLREADECDEVGSGLVEQDNTEEGTMAKIQALYDSIQ